MSKNSLWWDAYRRFKRNKLAVTCFFIICFYTVLAILASFGVIAADFNSTHMSFTYQPPDSNYWLGTDIFGRNVFSRAIHGAKTAIAVGFIASLIATPIGIFLGALAGYFGGRVDDLIVWLYTTIASIPYILLLLGLVYVLGQGLTNVYIALGLTAWVPLCRLVRAEFMKHKDREYVQAANSMGAGHMRRMFIHILPNVFHIALIQFSLRFVFAIKAEVILTYLGLGAEAGTPSWGMMINDAKMELARGVWWQLAAATLFMFGLILAFNLFNDALRDTLDPKLKNG